MRDYIAFVQKEFRHIMRDRRTLLILFGMPVAQVLIFGFALNNEVSDAGIIVWDRSGDYESRQLQQSLDASGYFHLEGNAYRMEDVESAFKSGQARLAVLIPAHFGKDLNNGSRPVVKILADASDPNQAQMLTGYAKAIIDAHLRGPEVPPVALWQMIPRMVFNPELKAVYMFVPGVMGFVLLLVGAMMTSLTIAREKELGTMEILLVSPLRPVHIILGKVTPYWALSFLNSLIIITLSVSVFHMPVNGSLLLLIGSCLLFSLTALALGVFVSSRSQSQMTAMFICMLGLLLPTILLSGFIFPIENMPWPLQAISHLIPARWFIEVIKGVMIKGSGLALLWKPLVILIGFTAFLGFAAIRSIKPRLEP